jgi:hypothetical protein
MIEALKLWLSKPETWFNLALVPLAMWLLRRIFAFVRTRLLAVRERIRTENQRRIGEYARDDALTMKVVVSREAWLVVLILGGLSWFAFVSLSPLRVLLELGTPVFLLTMSPVWILEILFLSRDSFAKDVLAERKILRAF